tara:strand:- start:977 stop:1156 length:180 start_codon:yes stop_codon:yes gene_type:complete
LIDGAKVEAAAMMSSSGMLPSASTTAREEIFAPGATPTPQYMFLSPAIIDAIAVLESVE